MSFQDRQITCMDCGQPFVFTAGEQEFYERKGFKEEPKRCKACRDARKNRRMGQLQSDVGGSPPPADVDDDIGNRLPGLPRGPREVREVRAPGRGGKGAREMFDAVCAQCGAATRVPFRPVAGRPVYCKDCYGGRVGGQSA
jgi:CxxC-x17-CxxC domain-containing protein